MSNEEAIQRIDDVLSSDYHYDETLGYQLTSDDFEWLEKSKKALEKQIPKKVNVTKYDIGGNNYFCSCGNKLRNGSEYCDMCGCKLDWSDTE